MTRLAVLATCLLFAPLVAARLEGLRDIKLPELEQIHWWPPAPGWWLLLLLLLLLVPTWRWVKERTGLHHHRWQAARSELVLVRRNYHASGDARALVRDLSVWLRRAAMALYGRRIAAGLAGDDWLTFLDKPMPVRSFAKGAGRVLAMMPYRNRGIVDADVILALCEQWLLTHRGSATMHRHVQNWQQQYRGGAGTGAAS